MIHLGQFRLELCAFPSTRISYSSPARALRWRWHHFIFFFEAIGALASLCDFLILILCGNLLSNLLLGKPGFCGENVVLSDFVPTLTPRDRQIGSAAFEKSAELFDLA
jgi:hypothetical protein